MKYSLLILDMLNTFDFPEAPQLEPRARKAARQIAKLKKRAKQAGMPVIYVNDNFEQWQSDRHKIFEACTQEGCRGKTIAEILEPTDDDYFILKPKHSGFYFTNLDVLLKYLKIKTLVLTGIAGNICVLFTAHDAHMREYEVAVPRDCMASNTPADDRYTVHQLSKVLKIRTPLEQSLK
jgi:nicotinamidase-related amidase